MSKATVDRIIAAVQAHEDEHVAYQQGLKDRIAGLVSEVETVTQNNVRLGFELRDLRAEYEAYKTTHPDQPPHVTLLGAGGGNRDRTKDGVDIDRWYGGKGDVDKGVARAKANHAAGVRTWLSFKVPYTWADMAASKGDTWATDLLDKLSALDFEVWVAFHHEPEGDGTPANWRTMQDHLSRLPRSPTIVFTLIVTGWHQEMSTSATWKWDALYPTGAPIDVIAYDQPYNPYGAVWEKGGGKTGAFEDKWVEGSIYVEKLAARAKAYGVKAAIGECGYSDEAFEKDPAWLDRFLASAQAEGLEAVAYFDTPLNSVRSWHLGPADSPKRQRFNAALEAARQ